MLLAALPPTDGFARFTAAIDERLSPAVKARLEEIKTASLAERDALMKDVGTLMLPAYFADQSKIGTFLAADAMHSDTAGLLNAEAAGDDLRAGGWPRSPCPC